MINKRGQFFLIVTGVLAVILIGLAASVNNAIIQPAPTVFYDLSKNFNTETIKVVDYGVFHPSLDTSADLAAFIDNFTEYAREKDPNIELVYLFGNNQNISVFNSAQRAIYTCNADNECTSVGGEDESSVSITIADNIINKGVLHQNPNTETISAGDKVTVKIGDLSYPFVLPSNNQFYFILRTEKGKETYVSME